MKEQLKKYFSRYVSFSDIEMDEIYSKLRTKSIAKKDYLLREGEQCRFKYFVVSGLLRSFYLDNKGNERITQFAIENWWVTDMESFIRNKPALSSIQALEETTVLMISKEDLEGLYISVPKVERLLRIITENMLIAIQRRNDVYLQMPSRDRYLDMVEHLPTFVQRVPQYMIASYLEITPEYLSELRKKGS